MRTLIVAVTMACMSCSDSDQEGDRGSVEQFAEELSGDNILFFKGGSGLVGDGLYVRERDERNWIYSSDGPVSKGSRRERVEVFRIGAKNDVNLAGLDELKTREGQFVVFLPKAIHFLDFRNDRFGVYRRK